MLFAFPTDLLARRREFSHELNLRLFSRVVLTCVAFQSTSWDLDRKGTVLGDGACGEDQLSWVDSAAVGEGKGAG